MRARGRTASASVGLMTLALLAGCGDDGPTGPGGGGGGNAEGPIADLAQALEDAQDALDSNEGSFASLNFFAPFIGGYLSTGAVPTLTTQGLGSFQVPCFAAEDLGTTYDYDPDSNAYVATGMTGAPAGGVRFQLYGLDGSGSPQFGSLLGYLDLVCTFEPTTNPAAFDLAFSVAMVADGVEVLGMDMAGLINVDQNLASIFGTGALTAASGSPAIGFEGGPGLDLAALDGGFTFILGNSITAGFGRLQGTGDEFGVAVNARRQVPGEQLFDWNFELFASGTGAQLELTPLTFDDPDVGSGTFACVQGSFTAPTVTAAGDCTATGEFIIPGVGAAELQATAAAYGTLHGMWAALIGFLDGGLEIVVASVTQA